MRTPLFSGFGKLGQWKGRSALEVFKFALYVSVPIMSSVFYANPDLMHSLILRFRFVEYPEAAPRPPVGNEIDAFRAKMRTELKEQANKREK